MFPTFPGLLFALATQVEIAEAAETGGIQGNITDETGLPVPNAELRLSGADLAGERIVTADENGDYRFDGLSPGTYELAVLFHGALVAKAEIRVALNTVTTAPIEARMGAVDEEIEVVGFKPVVDTTSSSFSTELSAKEMQEVPVGRSYQDVVATMPGVSGRVDTSDGGGGDGNPSVRGEGQYGNNYTIDGVSTRDPATKTFGQNVNFDAIESIQVYTDGAPAEFGQFTGMMVNVVTKDGGDEHHGSAALFYSQHAWAQEDFLLLDPDDPRGVESLQPKGRFYAPTLNLTAGGPIVPERLWYFSALDLDYSSVLPQGLEDQENNWVRSRGGALMGKVTWFPTRSWTLRYILNTDISTTPREDAGVFVKPEATSDRRDWGMNHRLTATFTPDDKTILELKFGYLNQNIDVVPTSGDRDTPSFSDSSGVLHGNATQFDFNDRNRWGGGFAFTRFVQDILGDHKFKAGSEYWLLVDKRELVNTGITQAEFIDPQGNPTGEFNEVGVNFGPYDSDPLDAVFDYPCREPDHSDCGVRQEYPNVGPIGNKVHTVQAYVQDDWKPAPGLTLNLGVRLDVERGLSDEGKPPPTQDPLDYTKPIDQRKTGKYGAVFMPAPRLGFAWDPANNGRTKLSGHYGQYYDISSSSLWSWANARSASNFVRYIRDPATNEFAWSNTQDSELSPLLYANDLRPPVLNKINLAVEREVGHDFSLGLRGIMSATTGIPEDVDVNANDFYIMNVPIKRRFYRALELTARKQWDEVWQVWGSYTLSESWGNAPGQFELAPGSDSGSDGNNVGVYLDDIGERSDREYFIDHGLGWVVQGFKGLGRYSVTDPDFYDEAGWYGYLPYHSFHSVKLNGSYTAPFGTEFGLVYEFDSGHAWEKRTLVPFYGYDAFGQGRGSRFMPPAHYVDVRIAQEFTWGKAQSMELMFDVFNLPGFAQAVTYYSNDTTGFGRTLYRQDPRSIRLGLKYRY